MVSLLFTIGGAVVNTLTFCGTDFVFSRLTDHGAKEGKRHDLAEEKLQKTRDEYNEDQIKRIDFINKILRKKNEAGTYINNVDEAMLEYYRIFRKKSKAFATRAAINQTFINHQRIKKMVNYYLL